jgi:hypothetical protein
MEKSSTRDLRIKKKRRLSSYTGKVVTLNRAQHFNAEAVGSHMIAGTTRIWNLETFVNRYSGEFNDDEAAASRVHVVRAMAGTQAFDDLLNTSTKVKWVFTIDNHLWAVKVKHVLKQKGQEEKWGKWEKAGETPQLKWKERFLKEEKLVDGEKLFKKVQDITHAVAADNLPCYAAGMAEWHQGKDNNRVLMINNHTGHYKASPDSLEYVGLPAWKAAGVDVVMQERTDHKKE